MFRYHPSLSNFKIRVLSVSHSIELAAPGNTEHWPSKPLCLAGQRQIGHILWHRSSHIRTTSSSPSGAGNFWFCYRFDTGRGTLYMPRPSEPPAAKDCHDILIAKFIGSEAKVVLSRCLVPQIQQIMQRNSCRLEAFSPHVSIPWHKVKWTLAVYTLPHTLMRGAWRWGWAGVSWTFPRPCNIWRQWHCHSPHRGTACHPGSRKWPPIQACCRRHPLGSLVSRQWAEPCHDTLGRCNLGWPPVDQWCRCTSYGPTAWPANTQ